MFCFVVLYGSHVRVCRVYHFRTDDAILKAGTDDALAVIARIQDP